MMNNTTGARKRATDFPQALLDLFEHYVHGEISRRQFMDEATKFAVGGLTALAIWESLKPNYALAEQVPPDDKRLRTEDVTVPSPEGTALRRSRGKVGLAAHARFSQ